MECAPLYGICGSIHIPQRFILVIMLQFAIFNGFLLRTILDVVVLETYERINYTTIVNSCPEYTLGEYKKSNITFPWSDWLEQFSGYAFYVGYAVGHLPGGWLADKLGARHVLGTSMIISATVIILLPYCLNMYNNALIVSLKGILGVSQGFLYPAVSSFIQHWIPYSEKPLLGGIAVLGDGLAVFLAHILTGFIISTTEKWSIIFYMCGSLAVLWYIIYLFTVFSKPSDHPFIDPRELAFLNEQIGEKFDFPTPWRGIIKSSPVWALLLLNFGESYISFTLLRNFRKYMYQILKWRMERHVLLHALPYLLHWIAGFICAWMAGYILNHRNCSLVVIRKIYAVFGNIIAAACLLIAVHLNCNRIGAKVMHALALLVKSAIINCVLLNPNDLTIHYAGTIIGLCNGLSATAGIIGPFVIRYLTQDGTLEDWKNVFGIIFGVCFGCTAIFIFYGEAERQPWDYPPDD